MLKDRHPIVHGTAPHCNATIGHPSAWRSQMKRGRKAHAPTQDQRKLVQSLSAYGVKEPDIAREIGINETTLRKYYRDELDLGHVRANAKVAETLFRMATSGEN